MFLFRGDGSAAWGCSGCWAWGPVGANAFVIGFTSPFASRQILKFFFFLVWALSRRSAKMPWGYLSGAGGGGGIIYRIRKSFEIL